MATVTSEIQELTTTSLDSSNGTNMREHSGIAITDSSFVDEDDSARTPFEYAAFVCSMFMLGCCIVGMFGNAMSVIIFTRPNMRSSINVLLTGLSLIDLLMLAASIPVFVVPNVNLYYKRKLLSESYNILIVFGPYQFGMISQSASVWTFVLISCERYLAVCHPLKVSRLLSVKRARLALIGIVCASICYNLVRFFEYRLEPLEPTVEGGEEEEEGAGYGPWLRGERLYFVFYHIGLYLVTHFLGPFVVIVVLHILILNSIRNSKTLRARLIPNTFDAASTYSTTNMTLLKPTLSPGSRKRRSRNKTTEMIVVVTAIFLVCNVLPFVLNIWEAAVPQVFNSDDPLQQSIAYLIVDLSNTLVVFNSAATFLLYIIYCKKYRELFNWYCLAPFRLVRKGDDGLLRRHLPLFLANEKSNSWDMTKLLTLTTTNRGDQRQMVSPGPGMATGASTVAATATYLVRNEELSDSDPSTAASPKALIVQQQQDSSRSSTIYATTPNSGSIGTNL